MGQKDNVFSGLIWSFAERFGAQIVSFVVSIVLARLLLPEDYGMVALVTVFINIANVFVTNGFGSALIQKKDADNLDFSSVFYFNLCFSACLYFLVFFAAPFIEAFYRQDGLTIVIRVVAIRLLLTGINSVQKAYVSRKMQFKMFFIATLGGTLLSAIVGIVLAYLGYGVWALVAQYLTNTTTDTIVLWFTVGWRPQSCFSFARLKLLISYGWKLLASSLLSTVYLELNELVIGKVYTSSDLAYYNKGKKFPSLFVTNINAAVETVLFPVMSKTQNDITVLKKYVEKSIKMSSFFVFPIVFGLAAVSRNLIVVLLTDKWKAAAIYLTIACISYAFVPIGMTNLQAIKAIGRSDVYLALDVVKKILGITLLILFVKRGVIAIAIAESISNAIGFVLNIIPNRKFLNYGIKEQIYDIMPSLCIGFLMFLIVFFENGLPFSSLITLLIQIVTGVGIYIGLSYTFKIEASKEAIQIIKSFVKR